MNRTRAFLLSLALGASLELLLLTLGGFDLRVGGDGPASMLLFLTHMPAGLVCAVLPISWQTEVAVMIANGLLLSFIAFAVIAFVRAKRVQGRRLAQPGAPLTSVVGRN